MNCWSAAPVAGAGVPAAAPAVPVAPAAPVAPAVPAVSALDGAALRQPVTTTFLSSDCVSACAACDAPGAGGDGGDAGACALNAAAAAHAITDVIVPVQIVFFTRPPALPLCNGQAAGSRQFFLRRFSF
jgi:hypothetical protein